MTIDCCNMGRTYLEYFGKSDMFVLQLPRRSGFGALLDRPGEIVVDYCPWCGVALRKTFMDKLQNYGMSKL